MFGGSGSAGTPAAAGTSGTNVFGSTAPSTGSAFGGGGSLFGQPKPSGPLFASTRETLSQFMPSDNNCRCHSITRDDRHVFASLFCLL